MKPETSADPLLGSVFEGRYRLVSLLGRGGMGNVYVAEETRLGRRYALKVLKPELTEDSAQVERFLREAQTMARFEHPNIVDIHSFGVDPSGFVFFTMELLIGEDLESRIFARAERPYSVREACGWAIQIARAVGVVHQNGLIHRDLKTQNVFLARARDGSEVIKLLDFGIARPEEGWELTRTGNVLGTPSYMSPEQVRNEHLDRRSDIYSFGVLLFKLLTGRPPFVGDAIQVAMQHLTSPVPPPSSLAPAVDIPPALDALILQAMSKQPGDRHGSMEEIEQALVAAQISADTRPVATPPTHGPARAGVMVVPQLASAASPPDPPPLAAVDDPCEAFSLTTTASRSHSDVRAGVLDETEARVVPADDAPPVPLESVLDEATARSVVSHVATDPAFAPVGASTPANTRPARATPMWHLLALGASLAGLLFFAIWLVTRPGPDPLDTTAEAPTARPPMAPVPTRPSAAKSPLPEPSAPPAEKPMATDPGDAKADPQPLPATPTLPSPPRSEDPRSPTTAPSKTKSAAPKSDPTASTDPNVKIKERARACRRKHGAVGGPPLTVEYAIGSDGSVLRARPASDSPLGACLADAVKQARFEPGIRVRQEISL